MTGPPTARPQYEEITGYHFEQAYHALLSLGPSNERVERLQRKASEEPDRSIPATKKGAVPAPPRCGLTAVAASDQRDLCTPSLHL